MFPTAIVAIPTSLRILSEYGVCVGRRLAGRDVDEIGALALERARDLDGVVAVDAALHPIGRRDAHRDRPFRRPNRAHRAEDLQRIAQTILQRAAVLVAAMVSQRRDK